jgi:hypothetical protein
MAGYCAPHAMVRFTCSHTLAGALPWLGVQWLAMCSSYRVQQQTLLPVLHQLSILLTACSQPETVVGHARYSSCRCSSSCNSGWPHAIMPPMVCGHWYMLIALSMASY